MSTSSDNNPREQAFEQWLKEEATPSHGFTERTLAALSEEPQDATQKTDIAEPVRFFPTLVGILAIAAALTLALILFEQPTPTPTLETADTLALQDEALLTYSDLDYLVIEDILEMQEELETYAALD